MKELERVLGAYRLQRVVEVGCGAAPLPKTWLGVDTDWNVLRRLGVPVRRIAGDVGALPLRDACADAAVARGLLHHVPVLNTAVAAMARVVCPGGLVLVYEPSPMPVKEFDAMARQLRANGQEPEPRSGIGAAEMMDAFTKAGLVQLETRACGFWTSATPPFTDRVFMSPALLHCAQYPAS